jgi:hypothetical protein
LDLSGVPSIYILYDIRGEGIFRIDEYIQEKHKQNTIEFDYEFAGLKGGSMLC